MQTIETSAGNVHAVNWIWGPMKGRVKVMLELDDVRPLSEICADFDGLDWIRAYKDKERTAYEAFEGYKQLISAVRQESGAVQLSLIR